MIRRPTGNLFREIPSDVAFSGCWNLDCLPGCDLGRGHCQRLEIALRAVHQVHPAPQQTTGN
jgi:hypothetical protein